MNEICGNCGIRYGQHSMFADYCPILDEHRQFVRWPTDEEVVSGIVDLHYRGLTSR